MSPLRVKADRCPKCCGRGVDRKGRVCQYHAPDPEAMAAFIVRQKQQLDADEELLRHLLTAHRVCENGCEWGERVRAARKRLGA